MVELDVICKAYQAVQMVNAKAGGRDPYDPDVVAAAKTAVQLPFEIWSCYRASTYTKSKWLDLVWFQRDEVTGKLICHMSGLEEMVFLVGNGAAALIEVFIRHIEEINALQKALSIDKSLLLTLRDLYGLTCDNCSENTGAHACFVVQLD